MIKPDREANLLWSQLPPGQKASGYWLMAMPALGAALVLPRGGVSICITVMFIFAEFIPNLGAPYNSSSPFRQRWYGSYSPSRLHLSAKAVASTAFAAPHLLLSAYVF